MLNDPTRGGLAAAVSASITDAASTVLPLEIGHNYLVSSACSCHVRLGTASDSALASDFRLAAGEQLEVTPAADTPCLLAIATSGASGLITASKRTSA